MIGLLKKINGFLKRNYHWLVLTVFLAAYLYYEFLYQISPPLISMYQTSIYEIFFQAAC